MGMAHCHLRERAAMRPIAQQATSASAVDANTMLVCRSSSKSHSCPQCGMLIDRNHTRELVTAATTA